MPDHEGAALIDREQTRFDTAVATSMAALFGILAFFLVGAEVFTWTVLRTVLSWPVSHRRAAARNRAEQFPWSSTIDAMLDLHTTERERRSQPLTD